MRPGLLASPGYEGCGWTEIVVRQGHPDVRRFRDLGSWLLMLQGMGGNRYCIERAVCRPVMAGLKSSNQIITAKRLFGRIFPRPVRRS